METIISVFYTERGIIKEKVCSSEKEGRDFMKTCNEEYFMNIHEITARMLHIENVNMQYNKETNFGKNPNGQEKKIENLLSEWDELKNQRTISKQVK